MEVVAVPSFEVAVFFPVGVAVGVVLEELGEGGEVFLSIFIYAILFITFLHIFTLKVEQLSGLSQILTVEVQAVPAVTVSILISVYSTVV